VECKPQVARCPASRKKPASGANCEAATDVRIRTGRWLDKVAGEKARQTRPLPVRAEARLTSQISRAGATVARRLLAAPACVVFRRGYCPERNANPKLHAVRFSVKNRLRVRIARRQPTLGLTADDGFAQLQAKRPAKPAAFQFAPRSGLHPKSLSRGHGRPWVTGRPGLRCVSPGLLPGAEYKPQVARCPAFREKPASGASCEAATDARVSIGRRVIQIAGEKARQTRMSPVRAEVRLVSQIFKPGPRSPVGYWPPRLASCFSGAVARSGAQTPSCTLSGLP